jgi:ATP-dependent Lon protease
VEKKGKRRKVFEAVTSFSFPASVYHSVSFIFGKPFQFSSTLLSCINQQNYKNNNISLESENSSNEEDILSVNCRTLKVTSTRDSIDDLVFRNPSLINPNQSSTSQVPIETTKKAQNLNDLNAHNKKLSKINTCKGLQRKLEQKVERAKKNFLQNEKVNQLENDIIVSFDQGFVECRGWEKRKIY